MGKPEIKSIDSLMKYLRDTHHIAIKGSVQKRKLRNIGYYHGFKGYRYITNPANKVAYNDFNQLIAVNEFDMRLKALFYPQLMFIETALKNYVLEIVLREGRNKDFNYIYSCLLIDYKKYRVGCDDYKKAIRKRLELRNTIYNVLTENYNRRRLVQHFYHKDLSVPIWAIFEMLTLGYFGDFVHCLELNCRKQLSIELGINQGCDSNARLPEIIIYVIRELRNAVAHNDVIFDARFRTFQIGNPLLNCLTYDTKVTNIDFNTIVDYVVLIVYLLKNLNVSRTDIKKIISEFENITETLRKKISISIFSQIIPTDTRNKLSLLRDFVRK